MNTSPRPRRLRRALQHLLEHRRCRRRTAHRLRHHRRPLLRLAALLDDLQVSDRSPRPSSYEEEHQPSSAPSAVRTDDPPAFDRGRRRRIWHHSRAHLGLSENPSPRHTTSRPRPGMGRPLRHDHPARRCRNFSVAGHRRTATAGWIDRLTGRQVVVEVDTYSRTLRIIDATDPQMRVVAPSSTMSPWSKPHRALDDHDHLPPRIRQLAALHRPPQVRALDPGYRRPRRTRRQTTN